MANRLARERSPYLLQHQDNPVEWYPWGEDAFARARQEDKPIFLSIGYSTCHWCHVMAHESFENEAIAAVLNADYVSVKVDREERPDVDRVYMTFIQATTGSGGWPMSIWLTPSLEPFYGGTYYPPTSRWGRPGFIEVLREVARVWRDERPKVLQSAASIVGRLRALSAASSGRGIPGTDVLDAATQQFSAAFDAKRGGFGDQPKFPRPSELLFLLREYRRTGQVALRDMVLTTLSAMALGGMRDHLGGGFHRYSVDRDWRVPHFEKMLYDQAQLVLAYVEAAQASGDRYFANVALDTLDYVRRDMTDPAGGFYSAEDADSLEVEPVTAGAEDASAGNKKEGAFYVWHDDEIGRALGADADVFRARYGVLPDGNAPFDPQNEFTHKNLLYVARPLDEVATMTGRPVADVVAILEKSREVLRQVRATRPRPHLDDKVLTAWNGLMIAAFARAARMVDGSAGYLEDARRAARFIRDSLWQPSTRTLLRRYRQGEAGIDAYAEDYAYLVFGLLELFQADGDPAWLAWAMDLQRRQDELFWDEEGGGWFSTTGRDPSVLLRIKEDYDGAEPAASSIAVLNLLSLLHLTSNPAWTTRLERTLSTFGDRAARLGRAVPMLLAALSTYHSGQAQVVVVGDAAEVAPLEAVLRRQYLPTMIAVPVLPVHRAAMVRTLEWTAAMADGPHPAAYVCHNFICEQPATTADALDQAIALLSIREPSR